MSFLRFSIYTLLRSCKYHFVICSLPSKTEGLVPVPVVTILEAAAVSACLLATAVPLRRISRLGIVEVIGAAD